MTCGVMLRLLAAPRKLGRTQPAQLKVGQLIGWHLRLAKVKGKPSQPRGRNHWLQGSLLTWRSFAGGQLLGSCHLLMHLVQGSLGSPPGMKLVGMFWPVKAVG